VEFTFFIVGGVNGEMSKFTIWEALGARASFIRTFKTSFTAPDARIRQR
jgi:hypothetical protein